MAASRAIAINVGQPSAFRMQRAARPLHRPAMPQYMPAAPAPRPAGHPQAVRAQAMRAPTVRPQMAWLPTGIFILKLIASGLAGATITLAFWPSDRTPSTSQSSDADPYRTASPPDQQESQVYRRAPQPSEPMVRDRAREAALLREAFERPIPQNYPRRVHTVRITLPPQQVAYAPAVNPPPVGNSPAGKRPDFGALAGKPLRYLIGGSAGQGRDGEVTMVSYSTNSLVKHGISIAYCNLFEENKTGKYGPYLHTSDTARQYNEGQIDPKGAGWEKNLREQYERRRKAGFEYVELDNPDAYKIKDVIGAIELAATYNLKVIAKNPGITDDPVRYVSHPNVYGIIVEKGAGGANDMEALRKKAGKPNLPVWFVAFGSGRSWAGSVASAAKRYPNMGVTYSSAGEYGNAIDVLQPSS